MKKPWLKWYPTDWRAEPKLRLVSRAARSLWMDLIGLMHDAEPYGHLLIDGVSPTLQTLAQVLGDRRVTLEKLLTELEVAQVFTRTETGVIMCRRMVRDDDKAQKDKENGKSGGNPAIVDGVKGGVNPRARVLETRGQRLETREEAAREDASPKVPLDRAAKAMQLTVAELTTVSAWHSFPTTFGNWVEAGCDPERDIWPTIEAVAKRQTGIKPPKYFQQAVHDARDSRLNGSKPNGIHPPSDLNPWTGVRERDLTPDDWKSRLRALERENVWGTHWGPKPGEPGCKVPAELLDTVRKNRSAAP